MKKNIAGMLVAAASLTLACLCCPIYYITLGNTPADAPPKSTIASTAVIAPTDDVPICVQDPEKILEESEREPAPSHAPQPDGEYTLVTYTVNGNTILDPVYDSVPNNLRDYQQDSVAQRRLAHARPAGDDQRPARR